MFKRDFNKPNKEYFKNNKNVLIAIAVFLLVGILVFAVFGMNGNFELSGYNEFSVVVTDAKAKDFSKYQREVSGVINSYNGKFDTMLISGEGDNTQFVIRYSKDLSNGALAEINELVAEKLDDEISSISNHTHIKPIVKNADYVYTVLSILLIIVVASIFAYARYNGASALTVIIANLLGTLGFMSIGAILRLSIGMSYFAMLVILNMLIVYLAINLFETMHKSSRLMSRDFRTAIDTAVESSKTRMCVLSIGLMVIGLLFILFAPSTIKYVSLNLMFMAVILLAVALYVIPFVWSVFITQCRQRDYKIKASSVENKKIK